MYIHFVVFILGFIHSILLSQRITLRWINPINCCLNKQQVMIRKSSTKIATCGVNHCGGSRQARRTRKHLKLLEPLLFSACCDKRLCASASNQVICLK